MDWSITLIILAAGLFGWFLLTGLRWVFLDTGGRAAAVPRAPFHAVKIRVRGSGCELARSLAGRRFLADEAPRLPLSQCDRAACTCSYIHYDDRRSGERRLGSAAASARQERRSGVAGRRLEDRLSFG